MRIIVEEPCPYCNLDIDFEISVHNEDEAIIHTTSCSHCGEEFDDKWIETIIVDILAVYRCPICETPCMEEFCSEACEQKDARNKEEWTNDYLRDSFRDK